MVINYLQLLLIRDGVSTPVWAGFVACFGQSGCQEQLGEAEKGESEGGVVIYSVCIYFELMNKPFQIFHYSIHKT